jgi:hypothetical protein
MVANPKQDVRQQTEKFGQPLMKLATEKLGG